MVSELRRSAVAGLRWSALGSVVVLGAHLLQLVVLARLLAPADFGLMAMAMVVIALGSAYADAGISNAIIHRQETSRRTLSSLYWLNLAAGLLLFVLVVAVAPLVARIFSAPALGPLLQVSAAVFLLLPFGQQFQILLQRDHDFRPLALIEGAAALLAALAAIGAGLAGAGVWALVGAQLVNAAVRSGALAMIGWRRYRPQAHFATADLRGYIGFGLFQVGERSITFLSGYLDQLLLGLLLGPQVLGYYRLAWQLIIQPVNRINPIVTRVAYPLLARIQQDTPRLRRAWLLIQRLLTTVNAPLLLGLAAVAPVLVPALFGDGWQPAVPLVQLLALYALLLSLGTPLGPLLLARGRADWGFYANLAALTLHVPVLWLGARLGGATGLALAVVLLQALYTLASYRLLVRRLLGACGRAWLLGAAPAVLLAGAMAVLVRLSLGLLGDGLPALFAAIALGAVCYAGLLLALRREDLAQARLLWQQRTVPS